MKIFISEYLTSGACDVAHFSSSLLREGIVMLQAVLDDCTQLDHCEILTTLDHLLVNQISFQGERHLVRSPQQAEQMFLALAHQSEIVFVIAPETDGLLAHREKMISTTKAAWVGCSTDAIELCSDKLRLAEHLEKHQLPAIPATPLNWDGDHSVLPFPIVIKPRNGAGSEMTFLINHQDDLITAKERCRTRIETTKFIWQPFIAGTTFSQATLATEPQPFPVATQLLSDDGRFRYQGGCIPFSAEQVSVEQSQAIDSLVQRACATIDGINGYIGMDFIVPANQPNNPLIVEINPRLTTSYIGYRQLTDENIMQRILFPDQFDQPIRWNNNTIQFNFDKF